MAVQTGEGTIEIIYGDSTVPAGAATYGAYLARPDGIGEWPTVIVLGPEAIPTSSVKAICRVLARHGIAAVAPHLSNDTADNHRTNTSIVGFMADPSGTWSNAEYGFGVLAFELGIADASMLTASDGRVVAWAAVGSEIDEIAADNLSIADVPALVVGSREDDNVDIDGSLEFRNRLPRATWVVYPSGDSGFWSDDAEGFDVGRYEDAMDRIVGFFGEHLPPVV